MYTAVDFLWLGEIEDIESASAVEQIRVKSKEDVKLYDTIGYCRSLCKKIKEVFIMHKKTKIKTKSTETSSTYQNKHTMI